jgi:hypothetical protein
VPFEETPVSGLSRVNYLVRLATMMMAGWCGLFYRHSDDVFYDSFPLTTFVMANLTG